MVAAAVWGCAAGSAWAANPPSQSWQTNGSVRAITFANGVMYVGGQFTSVRPPGTAAGTGHDVARSNLAAFDAQTGALLPWNPRANSTVYSIAVLGSTVYLGGTFTTVAGAPRARLAAVTTTGTLTRWAPSADAAVNVVRAGPNGNLFVGGRFGRVAGSTRSRIAELTPAGALVKWAPSVAQVTGFACPPRCPPAVFTIAFSPGGTNVYFGGHFGLVDGVVRNEAAAVPVADATHVLAFNPNIYAPANCPTCQTVETSRVYNMIVTSTRVYTCGGYWKVNGSRQSYNVSAFNPASGALDTSFTGQDDGDTPGCALRNGILYVGGHFNVAGPGCQPSALGSCVTRHHVAAFDTLSNSLAAWNPVADSVHGLLEITASSKRVGFGGYFSHIGGAAQQGVALYQGAVLP
jgi:Domain of unknown function (DUF5122) beta-propeller